MDEGPAGELRLSPRARADGGWCPYCREAFHDQLPGSVWTCDVCETRHHFECAVEYGGCTIHACEGAERLLAWRLAFQDDDGPDPDEAQVVLPPLARRGQLVRRLRVLARRRASRWRRALAARRAFMARGLRAARERASATGSRALSTITAWGCAALTRSLGALLVALGVASWFLVAGGTLAAVAGLVGIVAWLERAVGPGALMVGATLLALAVPWVPGARAALTSR